MFFDPLYILLTIIGLPLIFLPQMWVKKTIEKYSEVAARYGQNGADIARRILDSHNLRDVRVEMSEGFLSDHYDPGAKVVRLSPDNYNGRSVSAVAIAAHECGHAIQHAAGYYPVVLRSAMVPVVNLGSQMGPILIFASLMLMTTHILVPALGLLVAWAGVLLFGAAVAFHFVTLPVELDASSRAIGVLKTERYLTETELPGAKSVLTAAAFTYVAAALYALIQLLYYVIQIAGASRQRD